MSQDRNTTLSEIPDKGALGQSTLGPSRPRDQGAPWGAEKGDNLVAAAVPWGEISVSHPKIMSPKNIFVRDLYYVQVHAF